MSADDDTFEIDIYGDDQPESEPELPQQQELTTEPTDDNGAATDGTTADQVAQEHYQAEAEQPTTSDTQAQPAPQSLKRKAQDDEIDYGEGGDESYENYVDNRPVDQGAMPSLKLAELHWWTTEEDVRGFCARAGAEEELHELSFGEHKVNGKSKGEAYLEFASAQAATAVKREIEAASQTKNESGARTTPFTALFTPVGNPFKTSAGAGAKKDYGNQSGNRGGAYNSFNNNRGGGFRGGRGDYNSNRGGGSGYNNNNNNNNNNNMRGGMQTQQQSGGWGMNGGGMNGGGMNGGGMGGFNGGFNNPMMAMAGMGGFGNMNRGGMMGNMGAMMGRGGFNAMGMGGMNMGGMMGGGRGGGMVGGRGGWGNGGAGGGAGFSGGYGGGGGGMQGQQDPSKRMKMG